MRIKKDRTQAILELLTKENRIEVAELAKRLDVSQVTMRKDLDELEQRHIITREHGFALLKSTDDLNSRIAYHYEAKRHIARKACELVRDGDTIMIENGSCCALLAEELMNCRKGLTIITNSAFIADFIRNRSDCTIILLGGIYQHDSQVMTGPMIRTCAENFYVDRFFAGTDGFSAKTGFTNRDQMRAQAVRDMAQSAEQVIILTESEKFSVRGIVPLNTPVHTVITDTAVPSEALELLREKNIEVILVSTEETGDE